MSDLDLDSGEWTHSDVDSSRWTGLDVDLINDLDSSDWIPYDDFAAEREQQLEEMLEHFNLPGASLELLTPPGFFVPPPPIPSSGGEQCHTMALNFDSCHIKKIPTLEDSTHNQLISVIVVILCIIILIACITIFLIWRKRRSKSRLHYLHQYQGGGASQITSSSQLYDDLLDSFHYPTNRTTNHSTTTPYSTTDVLYLVNKNAPDPNNVNLNTFLLYSPDNREENFPHPIYEEIYYEDNPNAASRKLLDYHSPPPGYLSPHLPPGYLTTHLPACSEERGPFLVQSPQSATQPLRTSRQFSTFRTNAPGPVRKSRSGSDQSDMVASLRKSTSSSDRSDVTDVVPALTNNRPGSDQSDVVAADVYSEGPDLLHVNYALNDPNCNNSNTYQNHGPIHDKKQWSMKTLDPVRKMKARESTHRSRTESRKLRKHSSNTTTLDAKGCVTESSKLMPNPDNILPQCAWTDDWPNIDNDNNPVDEDHMGVPDVVSSLPYSPSVCSPSDVTMSATSSEEYPECTWKHSSQSSGSSGNA